MLIVSGSVLNSPFVFISIADGPAPQIKSCFIVGSFSVHPLFVGIVSPDKAGFISMSWIRLMKCLIRSVHSLGVYSFFTVKSGVLKVR